MSVPARTHERGTRGGHRGRHPLSLGQRISAASPYLRYQVEDVVGVTTLVRHTTDSSHVALALFPDDEHVAWTEADLRLVAMLLNGAVAIHKLLEAMEANGIATTAVAHVRERMLHGRGNPPQRKAQP